MVDFIERGGKNRNPARIPAVNVPIIEVTCMDCGHRFEVPRSATSRETICPQCGKTVPIGEAANSPTGAAPTVKPGVLKPLKTKTPKPIFPRAQRHELAAEADEPEPAEAGQDPGEPESDEAAEPDAPPAAAESRKTFPGKRKADLKTRPRCPECGASMGLDAVVCVQCGYDRRGPQAAGPVPAVAAGKRRLPMPAILAIVLLAVAAIGYALFLKRPPAAAGPEPAGPAEPAPASPPVVEPEPAPETPAAAAPAPAEAEPAAPAAPEEPESRRQVRARLDAQYPLLRPADPARLVTRDRATFNGKIIEVTESAVRLYYQGSESEIPLGLLMPESRAQVDPAYREQMIDNFVLHSQPPAAAPAPVQ